MLIFQYSCLYLSIYFLSGNVNNLYFWFCGKPLALIKVYKYSTLLTCKHSLKYNLSHILILFIHLQKVWVPKHITFQRVLLWEIHLHKHIHSHIFVSSRFLLICVVLPRIRRNLRSFLCHVVHYSTLNSFDTS